LPGTRIPANHKQVVALAPGEAESISDEANNARKSEKAVPDQIVID
jgi:hypothetical protein